MAQRTYLIGLYLVMKTLSRYTSKWLVRLEENMTTEQFTCLTAVINAVNECLPLIVPAAPTE